MQDTPDRSREDDAIAALLCASSVNIEPSTGWDDHLVEPVRTEIRLPRLSIITPCLNRVAFIEAVVKSVASQSGVDVEHIMVDGGSDDGTLDVLARYPHLRVIGGPDRNSHHALNKGLEIANGEVVGFLMTDDTLAPDALARVAAAFAADPGLEAVAGRAFIAAGERIVAEIRHLSGDEGLWDELLFGTPGFCSWFFRRSLLARLGGFDESLEIAADRDLLIRAAVAGVRPRLLELPVCVYGWHPHSATLAPTADGGLRQLVEHRRLAARCLADPATPPSVAARLARWRSYETWRSLIRALRFRRWRAVADAMIAFAATPGGLFHLLWCRRRQVLIRSRSTILLPRP